MSDLPHPPTAPGFEPYWTVVAHWANGMTTYPAEFNDLLIDTEENAFREVREVLTDPDLVAIEVSLITWYWCFEDDVHRCPDVAPEE